MPRRTLICGSLAYDTIMVFPDRFARHILPEQTHVLSVSFQIGEMRREWGGCAGNIAYNLKALGGEPVVMATLGDDGAPVSRAAREARHRQRRRAHDARNLHGAGVHHHRPRRQPDHRVPSGRDERVAREPRRRRRRHRARHRRARRPRRHARARRAVREREDPVRVRSGPGAAAVLRAGADRDDRRRDLRRRQRLRSAAACRAHGARRSTRSPRASTR